jgi:hypothetical protein
MILLFSLALILFLASTGSWYLCVFEHVSGETISQELWDAGRLCWICSMALLSGIPACF